MKVQIYCITLANDAKHWFDNFDSALAFEIESRKKQKNPKMSSYFAFDGDYYWKIIEPLLNAGIDDFKVKFLQKYGVDGNGDKHFSNAIKASVQRNTLYADNITIKQKLHIKEIWKFALENITDKYKATQIEEMYLADVQYLKDFMNQQFMHDSYFAIEGFKISHAQKSLSLFLKYLWCLNRIEEPPACPVDAVILRQAHIQGVAWTEMNDINDLREILQRIKAKANIQSKTLAKWELVNF